MCWYEYVMICVWSTPRWVYHVCVVCRYISIPTTLRPHSRGSTINTNTNINTWYLVLIYSSIYYY